MKQRYKKRSVAGYRNQLIWALLKIYFYPKMLSVLTLYPDKFYNPISSAMAVIAEIDKAAN